MGFLRIEGKRVLVLGVSNRRSVATHIARTLAGEGAELAFSVQRPDQAEYVAKEFPGRPCRVCDAGSDGEVAALAASLAPWAPVHGLVHSLAFASFEGGLKPFHETPTDDFLQAFNVSCLSLVRVVRHFKPLMASDGAVVAMSISTTSMASESYGYMAPIKAALDSCVCFLAKSLSADTRVRVNAVGAGLLKTSASAGIPGYIDAYLYAEKATLRKQSLRTEEVADVAAFLLSPRASGINAQTVVVDAGMGRNYFDAAIVKAVAGAPPPA